MAGDLDAMSAMIDATLDYLRGLQDSEVARPIDMNALLQSLAEDAEVLGKTIGVEGTATSPYTPAASRPCAARCRADRQRHQVRPRRAHPH